MKVLLVDVNYKNSSTGKIVYDIYNQMSQNGIEVAVCYGRGPSITGKNIYKFGIDLETYFHALMTRITGLTGFFSFISTYRLICFIKKFKPDIVHLHDLHAYFVNYGMVIKYLKKHNIRTIWTLHSEIMYTGNCGHACECNKWQTICDKCPRLEEYPKSLFFDFTKIMYLHKKKLFKNFDNLIIVTPSEWLASRVKKSFLKDKLIKVIYNGIDTKNTFYPRKLNCLKERHNLTDEKIVLAVAPDIMSRHKGGHYVLELAKKFREENIKFVIVGMKNKDLNKKYQDNIIPIGFVKDQNLLADYYSLATVFIICSSNETFSLTCAEALACGTRVIGFKSGAPESIYPSSCSSFIEYGDIRALEKKVRLALNSPVVDPFLISLSAIDYSISKMNNNYWELYKNYPKK